MSILSILSTTLKVAALSVLKPVNASFGLLKDKEDERDWKYSALRAKDEGIGIAYSPKNYRKQISTLSVKDQRPYNICCFAAATLQKEKDEGVELSPRSLVAYAKSAGYITGNGYSSLRNAQQAVIEHGIAEASLVKEEPKNDWSMYSSHYSLLAKPIKENAAKHKAKSQLLLTSQSDWFHALDNDRIIQTGCKWYTGYNNLKDPYVLPIGSGVYVGGHSFACVGYDIGNKVFICQNSFGSNWGSNGIFYVRFADFSAFYQGRLTVDIPEMVNTVAATYEGKDIKSNNDPKIYRVMGGKKLLYPDEKTFFSWGGKFGTDKTWVMVSSQILSAIPDGGVMKLKA